MYQTHPPEATTYILETPMHIQFCATVRSIYTESQGISDYSFALAMFNLHVSHGASSDDEFRRFRSLVNIDVLVEAPLPQNDSGGHSYVECQYHHVFLVLI